MKNTHPLTKSTTDTSGLPDLVIQLNEIKGTRIFPKERGKVKIVVTNQGTEEIEGPLVINLYASTDTILDSRDELLGSLNRQRINLAPDEFKTFKLDFASPKVHTPSAVAPGAYYLIAKVDPGNIIVETDETNNLDSQFASIKVTDAVLDWNATVLNAVAADRTTPPVAARTLAMVHVAIYDAVNAIDQTYSDYYVDAVAPEEASPEAAAAAAAHRILVDLYPAQTATFDTQLELSLAKVADGQSENDGIALGEFVADQILVWRSTDGSSDTTSYTPGTESGDWQPTPPGFLPALLPQWPSVMPFAMTSGDQFQPSGPPDLASAEYAAELNQVKELGSIDSTTRTADQTEIALFWADGAGTFTPPGHWNQIAQRVALAEDNTLSENARLFALLNIAEADAAIVAWDAKYEYDFWRPFTAIQEADTDGNSNTIADPNWTPLLVTPPFPEYVSGHSTFSGAAAAVLTSFFGDNVSFTSSSLGTPGISRSFDSFLEAASEAGLSRIYGGIHFASGNEDGLAAGTALGNYVSQNFLV